MSPQEVREVRRGELDELHLDIDHPPVVGSLQAVQTSVGKRRSCTVRILDRWEHRDGGWVVRVELAPQRETVRLLRPKGGYATDARYAMKDSTVGHHEPTLGPPPEPEAVDAETLAAFGEESRLLGPQANALRRIEYLANPFLDRLETAIMEAERLGLDAARDMARLEAGLAKLERRNALARQQRRVRRAA